ncbi:MAG: hypothetical protein K0S58_2268 [Nitrospira sp.]|jgi:hypothetical protein|nr:hypothetical protein [Nitrospira sp.]
MPLHRRSNELFIGFTAREWDLEPCREILRCGFPKRVATKTIIADLCVGTFRQRFTSRSYVSDEIKKVITV